MTLWYSRVELAAPLVTLAEAKVHLRIVDTDTTHDADITPKLAAAEEQILAKLGHAADPSWAAATAPRAVRHAVLILLDAFYERRGGDEGSEELRKALETVDLLLAHYRDPTIA